MRCPARVKRFKNECPKALDPAERLAMEGEAGGANEVARFAMDGKSNFISERKNIPPGSQ